MSESRTIQGEVVIDLLLNIRMDGFVTGYASAILSAVQNHPGAEVYADHLADEAAREVYADHLADEAAREVYADPLLLEAQRREVLERLAGVDSGPITIRGGHA